MRDQMLATVSLLATLAASAAAAAAPNLGCFEDVAKTRSYGLGFPVRATPAPDGKAVLYLRSGPRDISQRLYEFDIASGKEREVITPEALLGGKTEKLSAEEKARRERARISVSGFTGFEISRDGARVLLSQGGTLYVVERASGKAVQLPGSGWIAPKLSPDGSKVAALRDDELHVIDIAAGKDTQLTTGASATLHHGEAEFVAQEEMDRDDGFWWSPDSKSLAYEEADLSPVEVHYVSDPLNPQQEPVAFRYPRAGTANAKVRLGVIAADGGATTWIPWDTTAYPYLARVVWMKGAPLSLLVINREQTEEKLFAADPASGATKLLLTERDRAWLDLPVNDPKSLPYWLPDGSAFLWETERNGQTQLEMRAADGHFLNAVTQLSFRVENVLDVNPADKTVVVRGDEERPSNRLWRGHLSGGALEQITPVRGLHNALAGDQHQILAHTYERLDGTRGVDILDTSGRKIAELPSVAAIPPFMPKPEYFTVGTRGMDAVVLKPRNFDPARKYPVILSVYAGPASKLVWASPRRYLEGQCLADQGYILAAADNRGTPGRDSAWIRAIKNNAIDIPLADQVEALKALGTHVPQMDLTRTGVVGWSFGGYFSAMAVIRRPDVFAAGVAGAPVVDWEDYDTFYTERYMGLPQTNAKGYAASNVLTYASGLSRPLLIVHGTTDDNVYFEHTMKLTLALLKAGKPYELLLLPGTHMLADATMRARETERQLQFFSQHLGSPR